MEDVKTVDGSAIRVRDPLLDKQKADVANMRAALLCDPKSPADATQAMRNITVLRVYHQVSRIIRYLEIMDKLEEKLYETLDNSLDNMDTTSPMSMMTLLSVQEKLQKNMIESHKLLEPYLNIDNLSVESMAVIDDTSSGHPKLMSRSSRDKIRASAQAVLSMLDESSDESND